MVKFKIGDKLRILDKSVIQFGYDLTDDKVYDVVDVCRAKNEIFINDDRQHLLAILGSELSAIGLVKDTPPTSKLTKKVRIKALEKDVARQESEIEKLRKKIAALEAQYK